MKKSFQLWLILFLVLQTADYWGFKRIQIPKFDRKCKIPNLPTSSANSNIRQNMFPSLVKFLPHHHHHVWRLQPRVPSYIACFELTGRRTLCSSLQSTHCNTRNTGDTTNCRVRYILEGTLASLYIVRRCRVHGVNFTSQGVLQINWTVCTLWKCKTLQKSFARHKLLQTLKHSHITAHCMQQRTHATEQKMVHTSQNTPHI